MPLRKKKSGLSSGDLQVRLGRTAIILVFTGSWFIFTSFMASHGITTGTLNNTELLLIRASVLLAPFLGYLMFEAANHLMDAGAKSVFSKKGGQTVPPHSEGEALVQREQFSEAADWFAERVATAPADWKAQVRLIEILQEYLDDPEREAEERSRLLKIEGVPEGLRIQSVFDLGEYWERQNRPDRAISVYKGFIWEYPEGVDSNEARSRIKEMETPD